MKQLTDYLIAAKALKTPSIIESFLKVDRMDFVLQEYREEAYNDYALPIGFGQTISQPTVVALMLELLDPKRGEKILDIGSGSGWTTTLLAECVGLNGKVYGLELVPELVVFGQQNLKRYPYPNAKVMQAKDKVVGLPAKVFDKILVSAADDNLPDELLTQFTHRLVIPIQESVWVIDKMPNGSLKKKEHYGFSFVPLIHH